jgi:protein-S-isoprenylcysteine O-methyltransferase Ste14
MKIIEMRPPRIAIVLVAIAFALHWLLPIWERLGFSYPLLGATIAVLGIAAIIWSWWLFKKRKVAICPRAKTEKLIVDGLYRFSRNPMYVGFVVVLSGIALTMGTLPFLFATFIYFIILNSVFIPFEEHKLENAFGSEYLAYKKRVRRWL